MPQLLFFLLLLRLLFRLLFLLSRLLPFLLFVSDGINSVADYDSTP